MAIIGCERAGAQMRCGAGRVWRGWFLRNLLDSAKGVVWTDVQGKKYWGAEEKKQRRVILFTLVSFFPHSQRFPRPRVPHGWVGLVPNSRDPATGRRRGLEAVDEEAGLRAMSEAESPRKFFTRHRPNSDEKNNLMCCCVRTLSCHTRVCVCRGWCRDSFPDIQPTTFYPMLLISIFIE